ncbi:unnamed protein product, partial [Brachionus calyciflorus]
MSGSTAHSFLANQFRIFKEDLTLESILKSAKDFAQMTLVDFTNGVIKIFGEEKALKNENSELKKLIKNQFKFKNYNFYNNEDENVCVLVENDSTKRCSGKKDDPTQNEDQNESVVFKVPSLPSKHNKTTYSNVCQQSNYKDRYNIRQRIKRSRFVVASSDKSEIKSASKIFHYYVGFFDKETTKESLKKFINEFAKVEEIEILDTKERNYISFHVQVYSHYNDKILDPNNWTIGVRVNRYFFANEKNEKRYKKPNSGNENYPGSSNNYKRGGGAFRGRGGV